MQVVTSFVAVVAADPIIPYLLVSYRTLKRTRAYLNVENTVQTSNDTDKKLPSQWGSHTFVQQTRKPLQGVQDVSEIICSKEKETTIGLVDEHLTYMPHCGLALLVRKEVIYSAVFYMSWFHILQVNVFKSTSLDIEVRLREALVQGEQFGKYSSIRNKKLNSTHDLLGYPCRTATAVAFELLKDFFDKVANAGVYFA